MGHSFGAVPPGAVVGKRWMGSISNRKEPELMGDMEQSKKSANGSASGAAQGAGVDEPIASLRSVRAEVEAKAIMAALQRTGWNRKQAARLLSISYRGLLYKIRRHNIKAA